MPDGDAAAALGGRTVATLEAYADTMVPGEKRFRDDRAVAGAARGPGAVHAGAVRLLRHPDFGLEPMLPGLAIVLNGHAISYAAARAIVLNPLLPPLVGLPFRHRAALLERLCASDNEDRLVWIGLGVLACLAVDLANQRPGLWRYRDFAARRALARPAQGTHRPATSDIPDELSA
ncbi:regulator [Bailinhaonella thermotolerans]|uniref:Regulator n=1 Tax=Bailinhaonella thermotolerans TaxID=1070861 RepID=A0A3A4A210_9ACTN|nr:regulator [Bailinhaonella thermotolerans]